MYGGNVCNTRAGLTSDPITAQTVSRLAVKWKFTASGDISVTPAVVAGQVYVADWGGRLYRLDAATGQVVWSRSVADILGLAPDGGVEVDSAAESGLADDGASDGGGPDSAMADGGVTDSGAADGSVTDSGATGAADGGAAGSGAADGASLDATLAPEGDDAAAAGDAAPVDRGASGVVVRDTPIVTNGLVIFGVGTSQSLVAVDQNSGALVWRTVLDPHPFAVVTSSPVLDDGRIYIGVSSGEEGASFTVPGYPCCTFRGSIAALDPVSGKILWQTPMIEDAAYRNADGTLTGFSGAAVWSSPTVDRNRKLIYATTGNNYSVSVAVADAGAPLPAGDHIESIVALDLDTGAIRWSQRMTKGDVWTFSNSADPDWDFGSSANLFQVAIDGGVRDVIGAGQKSGVYWAVDADSHAILWKNQVGPGGHLGGIHWGTATDGVRVYVGVNDQLGTSYKLGGAGEQAGKPTAVGSWAALDAVSGTTLWQVANPSMTAPLNGASVNGPLAVVNGVVFGGSMDADGWMYAFDAASGKILWSFKSGGSIYSGAAIADGVVYWGNGYPQARLFFGTPGNSLYAFALGP